MPDLPISGLPGTTSATVNDLLPIVNGGVTKSISTGNVSRQILDATAKTANYTLTTSDRFITVDASGANRTVFVPAASGNEGIVWTVKKIDSSTNTVTIDPSGSETIDGAANYVLTEENQAISFTSNGTNIVILFNKQDNTGGSPGGSSGQIQFNNSGAFGALTNTFFDSSKEWLGLNTASPKGYLNIKGVDPSVLLPNPPGTIIQIIETDIDAGDWFNDNNNFTVRVHTYKNIEGITYYSAGYLEDYYTDNGSSDHTYNLYLELDTALPTDADGYIAFFYWVDSTGTEQWIFDKAQMLTGLNATITTSTVSNTVATPLISTFKQSAIFEDTYIDIRDSLNATKIHWDKSTNRLGIGTTTPTDTIEFKSSVTSSVPNPLGSMTIQETSGYGDPYENAGNTHTYRAYCFKTINGKIILSSSFITASYTDDGESGGFYSVLISMNTAVPSGADGFFVVKQFGSGFPLTSYWLATTEAIDGDATNFYSDLRAQTTLNTDRLLLTGTSLEVKNIAGTRTFFLDSETGAFNRLNIAMDNPATQGIFLRAADGQFQEVFRINNFAGTSLFRVSATGAVVAASTLNATAGSFSTTLTVTGSSTFGGVSTFNANVTMLGLLSGRTGSFVSASGSLVTLLARGAASQTANIFEIRNSANTLLSRFASNGRLHVDGGLGVNSDNSGSNDFRFAGGAGNIQLYVSGSSGVQTFGSGRIGLGSTHRITWHSGTDGSGAGDTGLSRNGVGILQINSGVLNTLCDLQLRNLILDTTTGMKIGTATAQKLGFWDATPIIQPTTAVAAATLVAPGAGSAIKSDDTFDGYTLQQIVKALRNTGILA